MNIILALVIFFIIGLVGGYAKTEDTVVGEVNAVENSNNTIEIKNVKIEQFFKKICLELRCVNVYNGFENAIYTYRDRVPWYSNRYRRTDRHFRKCTDTGQR